MKVVFVLMIAVLALGGCGWFGGKSDKEAAAAATAQIPSDEVLKKDCADPQWKDQNLGLWYSVCRQPMRW